MAEFGGNRGGGGSGTLIGTLAGFLVGVGVGLFAPRLVRHSVVTPAKHAAIKSVDVPAGAATMLQLTAQPAQHGLLVSAPVPVQLSPSFHGKMARQQGQQVFTGFRNWAVTSGYLSSGGGSFVVRGSNGIPLSSAWSPDDYRKFVSGQALQLRVPAGQACTLLFQHKGHAAVELASFTVGGAKAS